LEDLFGFFYEEGWIDILKEQAVLGSLLVHVGIEAIMLVLMLVREKLKRVLVGNIGFLQRVKAIIESLV
jgi:hypothetical protein